MILLEYHNKIIEDTLLERFAVEEGKFESMEAVIADFDAVTYHIFTSPDAKNILNISMSMKTYSQLKNFGVDDVMKKCYGDIIVEPENGYDFSISIDCSKKPADHVKFAHDVALMKRNALASVFYKAFNDIDNKKDLGTVHEIRYRDDEAFFLKPDADRCTVIFEVQFKDPDDVVFAKVFLQEYQDARRTLQAAPPVSYSQKEPPLELKNVSGLKMSENKGFVSFVLFASHIADAKRDKTIDNIQTFRNYLHYHIKCSKAYMHTRMRNRVRTFLQVLNRAKSEPQSSEKKTMTGKTFRRADDPQGNELEYNI